MNWRMKTPCENCPFNKTGPGAALRRSLTKVRWANIKHGLLNNRHFTCHRTSSEAGNGTNLVCAGAIRWQEQHGVSSNLQRIMERIEYLKGLKK